MKLSVVVPAHNEQDNLPELVERLRGVLDPLPHQWEAILVDDGSTDATWERMCEAASSVAQIRALRLSRNFGHQAALSAGLSVASGDGVVTMDSDLQHPPEAIADLLARAEQGYDVVYAIRREREGEGWFKAGASTAFYRLLNRLARLDLPEGAADFRYMSRRVVDALVAMPERHRFLRGMTRWVGYRQGVVAYESPARFAGQSKYTLRHMLRFALNAIVSFSALPLRIASWLGFVASALGALYLAYVIVVRLVTDTVVPGWTSVVVVALILGGAQLLCLGIIGQYLGQMYDEVKGRPLFLISDDTRQAGEGKPSGPDASSRVTVAG
jgi:glycosyltransferase involved in cell wall biosynthesis